MSKYGKIVTEFAYKNGGAIINTVPVLHHGWESDELFYICDNGTVIGTNHGLPELVSADYLRLKQAEYRDLVEMYESLIEEMPK